MFDPPEIGKVHNCLQCSHQTASVFQLDHHNQRKHKNVYAAQPFHAVVEPEQFWCICCNYKSYFQFELYEHFKQSHNPIPNNHKNESFHQGFGAYRCAHCNYQLDSSLSLIKHYDFCEKVAPSEMSQGSFEEVNILENLQFNGANAEGTLNNVKLIQSNLSSETLCNQCSYRAVSNSHLMRHNMLKHATHEQSLVHEDINWLQCSHCSFRTQQQSLLEMHMNMMQHAAVVSDEKIDWFECIHCSYRTKEKRHLNLHALRHSGNGAIVQCNQCSYRAKRKSCLKRHIMLIHASPEEINWVQCEHCSYRCKVKSRMKLHLLRHAADKDIKNWFQCNHCSYRVKKNSSLLKINIHLLSHGHAADKEIDWFRCNQCSYRTIYRKNLKPHLLTHAPEEEVKWYECHDCSYRAKHKSTLKRHITSKHA